MAIIAPMNNNRCRYIITIILIQQPLKYNATQYSLYISVIRKNNYNCHGNEKNEPLCHNKIIYPSANLDEINLLYLF